MFETLPVLIYGLSPQELLLSAVIMEDIRRRFSQPFNSHLKMDPSYKLDEGYSEDTRSQDGQDSQTGMDQENENLLQSQMMSVNELSTVVSTLGEVEKAGMSV